MKKTMHGVLPLMAAVLAGVVCAEETAFTVTALPLGPDLQRESTAVGIKAFVSRLDGRPGFSASLAKAPDKWDACPAGVRPERWVSLAPVCIGARTDWLAFAFDAEGRPLCAARRPARQYDTAGIYPDSIPPGDKQIDRNAGIEAAAELALAWSAVDAARPRLRIDVSAGKADTEQSLPMMPAELEGIRALAAAAALQAETPGAGEPWTLSVVKSEGGYRLELNRPGLARGLSARVPREAVFPYLVRMIRSLSEWQPGPAGTNTVADFMLIEPGGARIMGWNDGRAYFDIGGSVVRFSALEGLIDWTATVDPRYKPAFTWGPGEAPGSGRPYSYRPAIAPIGKNGEVGRGPSGSEAMPWGFAILPADGLLVAQGPVLMRANSKTHATVWKWQGADRLTAGPLVSPGGLVLAGGLAGELAALNLADGSLAWKTSVPARLSGPMTWTRTEPARALVPSVEGTLFAVSADSGAVVWRADLGDTLAGGPLPTEAGLLAATRAGRVALLDPASGTILASWETGAEAAGCSVIGDKACWAGRRGRVAWLALPRLNVLKEAGLHALLNDGVATGEGVPFQWGTGDDIGLRGPAALVADEEGFVYVLPAP
jgi:hypothetical protein